MKLLITTKIKLLLIFSICMLFSCKSYASQFDDNAVASYCIGYSAYGRMKLENPLIKLNNFIEGLNICLNHGKKPYTQDEIINAGIYINEKITNRKKYISGESNTEIFNSLDIPDKIVNILSFISGYTFGAELLPNIEIYSSKNILKGITDANNGKSIPYTKKDINKAMTKFNIDLENNSKKHLQEISDINLTIGEKFAKEYSKQNGVISTPEGIYYVILQNGTGNKPTLQNSVNINYTGYLINGQIFDSQPKTDKQKSIKISDTIKGLQIILPQMTVGSKWEIVVPSNLAYGIQGISNNKMPVLPGSTVIYNIELVDIK